MKALERWMARRAARERRRVTLDSALLTGRAWRYAVYRVRFLFLRAVLRAGLHLVELILLSTLFPMEFMAPIIVIRGATAVVGGAWWGFLEPLRADVREHAFARRWPSARATIDSWLLLSFLLAALLVAGGTSWILTDPLIGAFSIFDTYVLGCLLRLGCDMVSRTHHSGMFAIMRIERPLWSLAIVDVAELAAVLMLWPLLGPWSFGIVIGATGILRAALSIVFVERAFRRSRIPRIEPARLMRRINGLPFCRIPAGLGHALANVAGHMDAFLIMALVAAGAADERFLALAILFHLVRPFLAAGFGWARLFYFDFKKLQRRYGMFFMKRFQAFVRRAGVVFSLLLAGVSLAWAALFWPEAASASWLLLFPFFLGRSLLGINQVQAFSYGRYPYLAAQGLVLAALLAAVLFAPLEADQILALVSLVLLLLNLVLGSPGPSPLAQESHPKAPLLSLPRWLATLAAHGKKVRVGSLLVATNLESGRRVTRALAAALSSNEAVTRFGNAQVLWLEPEGAGGRPLAEVVLAVAGSARRIGLTGFHTDGRAALQEAMDKGHLERPLVDLLSCAPPPPDRAGLAAEFARRFPGGIVLDDARGSIPSGRFSLSPYRQRRLLADVFRKSSGLSPRRVAIPELDLTVYCPAGEVELLFVAKADSPTEERISWRRLVEHATILHSLR